MKNKKLSKKTLILSAITLVSLGVIGAWIYSMQKSQENVIDGVNYGPPTEEEKQAGDRQKELVDKTEAQRNQPQDNSQKKNVSVEITDAGQYDDIIEVRSFIPNHFQNGVCIITFAKGDQKLIKQTPAKTDISTTICLNPNIARSEFSSAGNWQMYIEYNAKNAIGKSETLTVKIQ